MKFTFILAVLLPNLVQTSIAAPDIKEGMWEITAKVEMPGMPVKLPPVTHTQCITKENLVPENIQKNNKDCNISNYQMSANIVSWTVVCQTKQGTVTGNGKITYQRETFSGDFQMKMDSSKGPMNMMTKMSGHYIGACQ